MPKDKPLKSAYDVAMERKQGVPEPKPLTAAQKNKIAKLRKEAQAKLAEVEIMHKKNLASEPGDPEKIKELEEHLETDRRRIESALASAIAKVKEQA